MKSKYRIFVYVLYILFIFQVIFLFCWNSFRAPSSYPGYHLVKTMYEFSTPRELLDNQATMKSLVAPDVFEQVNLDNTLHTVNSYYKFGYQSSGVKVTDVSNTYVCYKITNVNVNKDASWLMIYTCDGVVTSLNEYRLASERRSD